MKQNFYKTCVVDLRRESHIHMQITLSYHGIICLDEILLFFFSGIRHKDDIASIRDLNEYKMAILNS